MGEDGREVGGRELSASVILLLAALVFSHKIGVDGTDHSWMNFVAIGSDGATVASNGGIPGCETCGFGLWSFPAGKFLRGFPGSLLALSADFGLAATPESLLDLKSGQPVARFSPGGQPVGAAFSGDGKYLAFVSDVSAATAGNNRITVMRTSGGPPVRQFGRRFTRALAIHPDIQTLASGHWDHVTLWNMLRGERVAVLSGFGRYVYGLGFSPDGRYLAAGTDDGHLQIWDAATRTRMHTMRVGWGYVSNPSFSPDGKLVAVGTYADGTLSLVDVVSGTMVSQVKVSMFGCGSVAFSPDGRHLITPSNGGQLGPRTFDQGGTIRVFQVTGKAFTRIAEPARDQSRQPAAPVSDSPTVPRWRATK